MMNHKLVFQRYGVRRPLKFRRRMAREDNRQAAAIVAGDKWWRGRHSRWSTEGQAELLWLEFGAPELNANGELATPTVETEQKL